MQLPEMAAWAWIPIVISAALFQTIRNAAQRTIGIQAQAAISGSCMRSESG